MLELISDIKHMEMPRLKRRYVSPDVRVIDDFANTRMTEDDALQIFKVMEYRYGSKSTIIASQLEPVEWHNNFVARMFPYINPNGKDSKLHSISVIPL